MNDRRALPGTVAGVVALALAALAAVLHQPFVLVLAALAAVLSVVLVLTAPDVPLRYRDRKARQEEAEHLSAEADRMAARAARFEAEAIAAREELAAAMIAAGVAGSSGGSKVATSGRADSDLDTGGGSDTDGGRGMDGGSDTDGGRGTDGRRGNSGVDRGRPGDPGGGPGASAGPPTTDRADDSPHPFEQLEALGAARRRHDDPAEAEAADGAEREQAIDEVERLRRLQEGLSGRPASGVEGIGRPGGDGVPPASLDPVGRITDLESGLFNQLFFDASLDKRISAARRGLRPLTVAYVEVLSRITDANVDPEPVADILLETLREADTVARTADGLFAVLLEDTPENGAIWTLERIRRQITIQVGDVVVRAGVSCYPAYAFTADQIRSQALAALDDAREWNQDRIEVTTADPDDD